MKDAIKAYACAYHNEVTGSRFLLVIEWPDGRTNRLLIDYGYFQEVDYRFMNYVDDLDPTNIDAIIVTHNHIDHTGLIPKAVKQGYRNKVYMTEITKELVGGFWRDCAEQQEGNAQDMRERYPDEAHKFNALYHIEDVERAMKYCVGVPYRKTLEILPGIKLTFWENGHILGAGMILLQCQYLGMKPMNFLFTGDLKMSNVFFNVPKFPKWFRRMELIMFIESTYGSTRQEDIKKCFRNNILEAFERKQHILIGAFAQGRMQEKLYEFKLMQDEGLIPPEYMICVDGPLGIDTTFKYQSILEWFNPSKKDFLPKDLVYVNPKNRDSILSDGVPKILITTSGMLSNGPAKTYVPLFLEHPNALIHLVGYAAEETMARKLLDAKREDEVMLGLHAYHKRAVVKTTRENSSHATEDQLLEFINMFTNIRFLGINHGNTDTKKHFFDDIVEECPSVEDLAILDRDHMVSFYQMATKSSRYSDIAVKKMPAKLLNESRVVFGKEVDPKRNRGNAKKKGKNDKKKQQKQKKQKQKQKKPKRSSNRYKGGRGRGK